VLTEWGAMSRPTMRPRWALASASAGVTFDDSAEVEHWPAEPQPAGVHAMSQCAPESGCWGTVRDPYVSAVDLELVLASAIGALACSAPRIAWCCE
jgi:hypothetical protein